jgi:hypothetical protein
MPNHPRLLYVVADGATARLIERAQDTGDFVTICTLDGRARLATVREEERDEPAGRSIESATEARHAVGREDAYRQAKAGFMRYVAEVVIQVMEHDGWEGVVLAAPQRLVATLRSQIEAHRQVVWALTKDLAKTPDHELHRWFDQAELSAR